METIKPGTRCECWNATPGHGHVSFPWISKQCFHHAVRLVTVTFPREMYQRVHGDGPDVQEQIAMCAACADYAERVK